MEKKKPCTPPPSNLQMYSSPFEGIKLKIKNLPPTFKCTLHLLKE
jgi:hypothetical protein